MEVLIPMACEVDEQLPPLPPNDVVHRIYRDVSLSVHRFPVLTLRFQDSLLKRQDSV